MNEWLPQERSPVSFQGERVQIAPGWDQLLAPLGICAGGNWQQLEGEELIASSKTACCYRLPLADGRRIYFKRENLPPGKRLLYWLRPSRNRVEVFALRQQWQIGIPSPAVLAFGEQRLGGLLESSFMVTLEVPGALDLRQFVEQQWVRMPSAQRKQLQREISRVLIAQLRRAHGNRFYHHDLKWRNLLLRYTADELTLFWIDAPRAKVRRWTRRRGQILDLSALARVAVEITSRFERMRFLRAYLGADVAPGCASALYRDVASHLARRPPPRLKLQLSEQTELTELTS